jgi:ABC-type multidrug transport system fused ATPase/permease subunit
MPEMATLDLLRRLVRDKWRAYAPQYALAFVFMALVGGTTAASAWMMRDVINEGTAAGVGGVRVHVAVRGVETHWLPLSLKGSHVLNLRILTAARGRHRPVRTRTSNLPRTLTSCLAIRSRSSNCGSSSDWDLQSRGDLRGGALTAFRLRCIGSTRSEYAHTAECYHP